jgi:CHAD domain-containing protein
MSALDTNPSASTLSTEKLFDLTTKRLEKFASLLPKALVNDHSDTIHGLRVWSRRLQQVLQILLPKPRSNDGRKLIRTLRKVRRTLGDCRNHDVCINLIQQKLDHANSEVVANACRQMQLHLSEKRAVELVDCRDELSRYDIIAFIMRTQALLQTVKLPNDLDQMLRKSVEDAFTEWQDAFTAARESAEVDPIHAFRLAGKRLRYRTELLADLGEASSKSLVKSLKLLQDDLGHWHDGHVLLRSMAEFIARPDFLVDQPEISRVLLTEMEKERHRNDAAVSNILERAEKIRDWKLNVALGE